MRRAFLVVTFAGLTACSTGTSFHVDNGVCYRTRENRAFGIRTDRATVQAVPSNCGLVVTTTTAP